VCLCTLHIQVLAKARDQLIRAWVRIQHAYMSLE